MTLTLRLGTLFVLATTALVGACGGGGGDDADGPPATADSRDVDASGEVPDAPPTPVPDARPISLGCSPDPTVIPEGKTTLGLSGTIVDAVAGATVDVFLPGGVEPIGSATSAADGTYSISSPVTPGDPAPLPYVRVRHEDYVTNFLFPADPVSDDLTFDPIMFDPGSLNLLYTVLGGTTRRNDASTLATLIVDCGFTPIENATFTSTPAAEQVLYLDTSASLPAPDPDNNTSPNGLALALNVPLGTVSVGGNYGALTLENHDVTAFTDGENPSITTTIVHPVPPTP